MSVDLKLLNTQELLDIIEIVAEKYHDGHFTIMKFTTCWKAMFGTPNLDGVGGRSEVRSLEMHKDLRSCLINMLKKKGE